MSAGGVISLLTGYPLLQELAGMLMEKTKSRAVSLAEQKKAELTLKELRMLAARAQGTLEQPRRESA